MDPESAIDAFRDSLILLLSASHHKTVVIRLRSHRARYRISRHITQRQNGRVDAGLTEFSCFFYIGDGLAFQRH